MVVRIPHDFRFAFMVLAGFLIVGATATWYSSGYLSLSAWFFEWADVVLAFLCVFMATRRSDVKHNSVSIILIIISALVVILPLGRTSSLPVFTTPDPVYYGVFGIPIIIIAYFIIFREKLNNNEKTLSLLFFLFVLGTITFVTYLFYSYSMKFPTDESVVDLYSAHLFLHGLNPYNLNNIAGGFGYYGYPIYANTPLTTGGYVYYLTYPALSFITMVPAEILNIKGSLVMLPFFAVPVFLAWYRGWSRKEWLNSALILLPFLSLSIYSSQVSLADLNIVWASLMMASYYLLPRAKYSGFLYGLALSVKQFPAITLPFFLFFIYKEHGKKKSLWWIISMAATFLAVNGYFMIIGFHSFLSAMLANETGPLIGVGFGPSQISFLGYLPIPHVYFTITMVSITLSLFVLYVLRYREIKYAIFAFPIIIFLFNYRLFVQYILYWLILALLPFMDLLHEKEMELKEKHEKIKRPHYTGIKSRKAVAAILIIVLIGSIAVGFNQGVVNNPGNFTINSVSVKGYNATGFVDDMSVNITYHGGTISNTGVLFRFVLPQPIGNANMYLWKPSANITMHSGQSATINIVPYYSIDPLPVGYNYRVIAYYGDIMGSGTGTT